MLSWIDVLKLAATTGVIAVVLQIVWQEFSEYRKRRSEGYYLAIRLANILERFAYECAEQIAQHELHERSLNAAGDIFYRLPELGAYPGDGNWRALDRRMLNHVLAFPNDASSANLGLESFASIEPTEVPELAGKECSRLGTAAWNLAIKLRKEHKANPSELASNEWFHENLGRHLEKS